VLKIYLIEYSQGSSYPEFSVVCAKNALDARVLIGSVIDGIQDSHVTNIQEIDISKEGIIRTGYYCC